MSSFYLFILLVLLSCVSDRAIIPVKESIEKDTPSKPIKNIFKKKFKKRELKYAHFIKDFYYVYSIS